MSGQPSKKMKKKNNMLALHATSNITRACMFKWPTSSTNNTCVMDNSFTYLVQQFLLRRVLREPQTGGGFHAGVVAGERGVPEKWKCCSISPLCTLNRSEVLVETRWKIRKQDLPHAECPFMHVVVVVVAPFLVLGVLAPALRVGVGHGEIPPLLVVAGVDVRTYEQVVFKGSYFHGPLQIAGFKTGFKTQHVLVDG
jgi:hypothetical protein